LRVHSFDKNFFTYFLKKVKKKLARQKDLSIIVFVESESETKQKRKIVDLELVISEKNKKIKLAKQKNCYIVLISMNELFGD